MTWGEVGRRLSLFLRVWVVQVRRRIRRRLIRRRVHARLDELKWRADLISAPLGAPIRVCHDPALSSVITAPYAMSSGADSRATSVVARVTIADSKALSVSMCCSTADSRALSTVKRIEESASYLTSTNPNE